MVFFGLRRETCDHVGRQRTIRHHFFDLVDAVHIPINVMSSIHELQDPVAAALERQMDVLTEVIVLRHRIDHTIAHVLRV